MATTIYELEIWDPITRRYKLTWSGPGIIRAEIQFNKRYIRHCTRRLIKITKDELYKAKRNEYLKTDGD